MALVLGCFVGVTNVIGMLAYRFDWTRHIKPFVFDMDNIGKVLEDKVPVSVRFHAIKDPLKA